MSTMQVRVFRRRPWQMRAARGMRRAGHPVHVVCYSLGIKRDRLTAAIGPHAFFKF
jgi:hypothetical protein